MLYVDDIALTGNHSSMLQKFVTSFSNRFSLKDLRYLNYFRWVKVLSSMQALFLSEQKYIFDLLEKTKIVVIKEMASHMSATKSLTLIDESKPTDATWYRQVVTVFYIYNSHVRILVVVNKLIQFMYYPNETH